MSIDKTTISNSTKTPVTSAVRGYGATVGTKPPAPEVMSLEIDENDDFGSDPYNRTGSHCVLKIGEDA